MAKRTASKEVPQLGIFWLHGGKIIKFSQPAAEIAAEGGFKDYSGSHVDLWAKVQRMHPELAGTEYEEIPRGRVTYAVEGDIYTLVLPSAQSRNKKLVERLVAAFGLRSVLVRVAADEHYDPPEMALFEED